VNRPIPRCPAARTSPRRRPHSSHSTRSTPDPEVVEGAAGWPATARGFHLVADPAARWHAPILARPRQPGALEPLGTAQALVAAVPEGLWRNRLWHETYFMGGIEAIYDDMNRPTSMARFAPMRPARGAMFSARRGAAQGMAQRAVDGRARAHRGGALPRLASRRGVEPVRVHAQSSSRRRSWSVIWTRQRSSPVQGQLSLYPVGSH
jgi:hypothetical protein